MRGDPLVDGRGRVYLTTTDGYLHAFEPDGRYRWSYTVSGAVMGRPVLRNYERTVLVGTTDRWLYAVTEAGQLDWAYPTLAPVMSGLVPAPDRSIVFVGGDGYVYSVSSGGIARWRAALGGFASADPLVGAGGVVWVSAGRELLRLDGAWRARRSVLPGEAMSGPLPLADGVAVVAGSQLVAFDAVGRGRFSKANVAYAAPSGSGLVTVSSDGRVEVIDAAGRGNFARALPAAPSEAPAASGGVLYVPLMTGALAIIGASAAPFELEQVGDGALGRPIVDTERKQLIVEVAGLRVCAVGMQPLAK
jgi:outer membrane protein assembly factor BamB